MLFFGNRYNWVKFQWIKRNHNFWQWDSGAIEIGNLLHWQNFFHSNSPEPDTAMNFFFFYKLPTVPFPD